MFKQILNFIIHLRLHYQVLILSGCYLLGGFMASEMNTLQYWLQYLNVHILLFGGATAYNSWWDKDTGPIGGLKHPPVMNQWMHPVSLTFMFLGFLLSFYAGLLYALIYLISLIFFWLYSTPHARWKSDPVLSLVAIGISTGLCSVLLGTLAAGGVISLPVLLASAGASFILLSLYPVSQIFQIEEDSARKDRTFAVAFGIRGVKQFFLVAFIFGSLILVLALLWVNITAASVLFVATIISGIYIGSLIFRMTGDKEEYNIVMKTKFFASFSFVCFFLIGNFIQHGWIS